MTKKVDSITIRPENFDLNKDHAPVNVGKFSDGLDQLAKKQIPSLEDLNNANIAFKNIENLDWTHVDPSEKKSLEEKVQLVFQSWVKVRFGEAYRYISREQLKTHMGPKFETQMTLSMRESRESEIELLPPEGIQTKDIDPQVINAFLDYIQGRNIPEPLREENALEFLILAHQNQIEDLFSQCLGFLRKTFDDQENFNEIWKCAQDYHIPELELACLSFMQVFHNDGTLKYIFDHVEENYSEQISFLNELKEHYIEVNHKKLGTVELRINKITDQTLSLIEKLSKKFPVKSLYVKPDTIEKREKKTVHTSLSRNNYFKFLEKVSKQLPNIEDLMVNTSEIKNEDLITLKTWFHRLKAFGNNYNYHLSSFDEILSYLKNFRSDVDEVPESKKLRLTSLKIYGLQMTQDQFDTLTPYLTGVVELGLSLRTDSTIESLDLPPSVTKLSLENMLKLKNLKAPNVLNVKLKNVGIETVTLPKAEKVGLYSNDNLSTVFIPEAIDVDLRFNKSLQTIEASQALVFRCSGSQIKNLDLPVVKLVQLEHQDLLTNINFPEVLSVTIEGSRNIQKVTTKKADKVNCIDNDSLEIIEAENASFVYCNNCNSLKTLKAPNADVDLDLAATPITLEIPLISLSKYYARKAIKKITFS